MNEARSPVVAVQARMLRTVSVWDFPKLNYIIKIINYRVLNEFLLMIMLLPPDLNAGCSVLLCGDNIGVSHT